MTQASTMDTQKQLRMGRIRRGVDGAVRHLVLIGLSVVWLVPILWLLVTSLSTYAGINFRTFFPDHYTFQNYIDILFHSDSVAQFPRWFMNTLVVACFNIVGSLSMLIIDKKDDVVTLRNLGASDHQIVRVFLFEGRMISAMGAVIGVALGLLLCWLQQEFGFVSLGESEGTFIINAYPVSVHYTDVLLIFLTVIAVGWLSVWYPVRYLSKRLLG